MVCRHSIFPSFRLIAITSGLLAPELKAVTKMRSPQMQGDPWPTGRSVFQSNAFVGPNSEGSDAWSFPIPSPPGPRNCGHLSPTSSALNPTKVHKKTHSIGLVIITFHSCLAENLMSIPENLGRDFGGSPLVRQAGKSVSPAGASWA